MQRLANGRHRGIERLILFDGGSKRFAPSLTAEQRSLIALASTGLLLELIYVIGFLRPFHIWAAPEVLRTIQAPANVLGTGVDGAARFAIPTLLAFVLYGVVLWFSRRATGRWPVAIAVAGTIIFSATLLPINPVGSHDVYHYVADARTLWLYGENPTATPPAAFPDDPIVPHVAAWQNYPSGYGPLWYLVSGVPLPFTGDGLWPNVIGQKVLTATFLLGTALVAMRAAERMRPGSGPLALVFVGWNPLLLFETAGNAHNDIVMMFFVVCSLLALTRGSWLLVFPLLALAVASKHVAVLLGPLMLIWMVRNAVPVKDIVKSLAIGALVVVSLYMPFIDGGEGYASFSSEAGHITFSLGDAMVLGLVELASMEHASSVQLMQATMASAFLVVYGVLIVKVYRQRSLEACLVAIFWTMALFLFVAKWWFWPWYLLWIVPLAAIVPRGTVVWVAVVSSLTAMLLYIPVGWLWWSWRWYLLWLIPLAAFVLYRSTHQAQPAHASD